LALSDLSLDQVGKTGGGLVVVGTAAGLLARALRFRRLDTTEAQMLALWSGIGGALGALVAVAYELGKVV
jgi:hypothetical protein